jgi:predicted transcriptional regulator
MYPVIETIEYENYQSEIKRHIDVTGFKLLDFDEDNKMEIIALGHSYSTIYKIIGGKLYNIGGFLGNEIRVYENTATKERYIIAIENISFRFTTSSSISYISIINNKVITSKVLIKDATMDGDNLVYYDSEYKEISEEEYKKQINEIYMNLYETQP